MTGKTSAATERAIRLVDRGVNPHAAALKSGISPSTLYRALKRIREKEQKQ